MIKFKTQKIDKYKRVLLLQQLDLDKYNVKYNIKHSISECNNKINIPGENDKI